MDPNPNYNYVSFADKLRFLAAEIAWPFIALAICIRRKGKGRITLKEELYDARFRRPDFAGYWMLRHCFTDPQPPSSSDIVLCYIHGGGYQVWQPGTVSVFALDYSLVPEAIFPMQIGQMAAMYRYMQEEMGVHYNKVAIAGDSAAGEGSLPDQPDLLAGHVSATYHPNDGLDMLSKTIVDQYVAEIFGASEHAGKELGLPYHEFARPVPGWKRDWAEVLPTRVWIGAGANEVSAGDIEDMAEAMRVASVEVELALAKGKAHVWQFVDCLAAEGVYLKASIGQALPPAMVGVEELANAIAGGPQSD
ncbi:alpha/beta-hydrolase [Punctularia strigosozonata HHB-11173 SS5]|uniref:alpha/beta-hydrolase n=1 Tax=Punctularia strigosozonata (strain HHB-11173) TaxID=741275 RepID=UPI0004416E9F|nr:alpha/beta-hydrolase [Punctularia strigosozonata HHB-11173 SS5]EIN05699.1 alpha/beta-hydrolase [Punctularia strigosozonata HHB-11173 SS5]